MDDAMQRFFAFHGDLREVSLSKVGLPEHTCNALHAGNKILTVWDLLTAPLALLFGDKHMRGLGRKSQKLIRAALEQRGLSIITDPSLIQIEDACRVLFTWGWKKTDLSIEEYTRLFEELGIRTLEDLEHYRGFWIIKEILGNPRHYPSLGEYLASDRDSELFNDALNVGREDIFVLMVLKSLNTVLSAYQLTPLSHTS